MEMKKADQIRRKELKRQLLQKPAPIPSVMRAIKMELEQIQDRDEFGKRFCVDCDKLLTGKKRNRCQACQRVHSFIKTGKMNQAKKRPCEKCGRGATREETTTHEGLEICKACWDAITDGYDTRDAHKQRYEPDNSLIGNGISQLMYGSY